MAHDRDLATFNLGVVLQETGINPDTLRAWERRYGLPMPERSDGGHRLYSERDIDTVKWLLERQKEGMRIGQAVTLWKKISNQGEDPFLEYPLPGAEMENFLEFEDSKNTGTDEMFSMVREAWLDAALAFQEEKAEQILTEAFARYSLEDVWEEVLVKGLEKIGDSWYGGDVTVQQEHFATSLVIQRLHSLIEAAPPPIRKEVITVACPPGEEHTLAPLLITLFLRRKGYPVIYLGANVPLANLEKSLEKTGSKIIILTAQILETGMSLVQTAQHLTQSGYRVGYGGRIFNLFPELRNRVPGIYLGQRLSGVGNTIQDLIQKQSAEDFENIDMPEKYQILLEEFEKIEYKVWDRLREQSETFDLTRNEIDFINGKLNQAIKASLYLGDIQYLAVELKWLGNLLKSRKISNDQLKKYLTETAGIHRELLDNGDNLIIKTLMEAGSEF